MSHYLPYLLLIYTPCRPKIKSSCQMYNAPLISNYFRILHISSHFNFPYYDNILEGSVFHNLISEIFFACLINI